jgi:hypothetical protein
VSFKAFLANIGQHIHSYPRLIPVFTLLVTLITWSFISILWSEYKDIAFYQSIKILEFGLLFLYIVARVQWFGINKFMWLIFISGFFESIIGVTQFYLQRSLGLKFLMESVLSPEIPNVAKIVIDGDRVIRAYGTFPHPNVFSSFLLLSIFCGLWLTFLRKPSIPYRIVSRETILYGILLAGTTIQTNAFIFTFSRGAWLSLVLIISVFIFIIIQSKLFHVKQLISNLVSKRTNIICLALIIPIIITAVLNVKYIGNRTSITENAYQESTNMRLLYNNTAFNIISKSPLLGLGEGNFTMRMQEFNQTKLELWQFQPVHNIYLLIMSELGIIGAAIFFLLVLYTLITSWLTLNSIIVSRETIILQIGLISILIGYLFIGFFDHYYWTLQQGQLVFWLVLGSIVSFRKQSS